MLTAQDVPERVAKRVLSKVEMGPRGCHISNYSVASHGYAQVGWYEGGQRFVTLCHRVIWNWFRGPIPDGMTVDHMCKNRKCVRLMHLRLIPNLENARRTAGRDWPLGQCANGHNDAEHWIPAKGRSKAYCGQCRSDLLERQRNDPGWREQQRERQRAWREANRERVRESQRKYDAKRRQRKVA